MTSNKLPPGLVLWPAAGRHQRIAVLISDIHCTDCTVGDQTADEADWKNFFTELGQKLHDSLADDGEVVIILNGDVVDLLRSGRWAAAGVYPWHRNHPRFKQIVLSIMRKIVMRHSIDPKKHALSSGFFHHLREMVRGFKPAQVTLIPIVGNHDKELQGLPEVREMYYRRCLGIAADDLSADYRLWVAKQMGSDAHEPWPVLPFYYADPSLRLFATHGQWRDDTNSRSTKRWKFRYRWQPQLWQEEQFRPFSEPCFGDTIACGLLSHFIWNAIHRIKKEVIPFARNRSKDDGISRIQRVLGEMDLYRPSEMAVVRLLDEAKKLDRKDADSLLLFRTVIDQYRKSLWSWLEHSETFRLAPLKYKFILHLVCIASWINWIGLNIFLMRMMARKSDSTESVPYSTLPIFRADYQSCGFQLHAEGHTHMTMEVDLRNSGRFAHRNYTYVNLGAWRNRIVQKFDIRRFRLCSKSYRRHSIGRVLIAQNKDRSASSGFGFTLRDITSWGDRLDKW
jgi:hypothetical protein